MTVSHKEWLGQVGWYARARCVRVQHRGREGGRWPLRLGSSANGMVRGVDTKAWTKETDPGEPKCKGMFPCEGDDIFVLEPQNPVYAKGRKGSDMCVAKGRRMSCLIQQNGVQSLQLTLEKIGLRLSTWKDAD